MLENLGVTEIMFLFALAVLVVVALGYYGGRAFARRRTPAGFKQTASNSGGTPAQQLDHA